MSTKSIKGTIMASVKPKTVLPCTHTWGYVNRISILYTHGAIGYNYGEKRDGAVNSACI